MEYITKDEALSQLTGINLPKDRDSYIALVTKRVQDIPAADVAPAHPARWIVNKERTEMVCSHCHARYRNMADEIEAFSTAFRGYYYCSYCGSRTYEIEYR